MNSKIEKFNEFINNNDDIIINMIVDNENTNLPDLISISERESYKKIIGLGKTVISYLLERNNIIWDNALSKITGYGLNPLKYNTKDRLIYWQKWAKENGY